MERDEFACVICYDNESTLNVHHCYYGKKRDPWDYDNDHLMTLCEECHKDVEAKREEILKELTWEVPIYSIHAIATWADSLFLANISAAFSGLSTPESLRSRSRRIRAAIQELDKIAEQFENQ
jgi:hypothetical protein